MEHDQVIGVTAQSNMVGDASAANVYRQDAWLYVRYKRLRRWAKQLLCSHVFVLNVVDRGYYDGEEWYECARCELQKEIGDEQHGRNQ